MPLWIGKTLRTLLSAVDFGSHARADGRSADALALFGFVVGDLDYLQKTSAGQAALRFDRAEMALSLPGTEWLGLTISATEAGGPDDDEGTVTFAARFRQYGQVHRQGERSEFRRIGGAWRYCRGEVAALPDNALRVGRNDPCPCGSGKKYKKCHGA